MPYKLLLADDSVTIQRVIELTFADEDITVFVVSDGQQAVDRIEADPPDIILADVGMPKRDGYEVAGYVKSRSDLSHIPVLLLTGAFEPVDQARAIAVGCDGVLAKPFEPQMVINRVKELLGGKRGGASRRAPTAVAASHHVDSGIIGGNVGVEDIVPPAPTHDSAVDMSIDTIRPPVNAGDRTVSLDDYFDQLDAAFSKLGGSQPAPVDATVRPLASPPGSNSDFDWIQATRRGTSASDGRATGQETRRQHSAGEIEWDPLPPTAPVTESDLDFSDPTGIEREKQHPRQEDFSMAQPITHPGAVRHSASGKASAAPAGPTSSPPIADAFAALLAAEQGERPAAKPAAPVASAPVPTVPASPAITDAVIDQVVMRVLERLNDTVVRDTVAETVSRVAERLVREEIERIKGGKK